ncbi:MAG: type IX secretion system protein PorQ [Bacteroidales bacterium]|nr:type IX secretion system protein PorQ [Bacteroidales bacterium]
MKRTILNILLLALAFAATAQQTNGTYAFLKATNSARVAALGGLPLPVFDGDIQLSNFNPSAIDSAMDNKLGLSYVDYYADINFATAQYARSFDKLGSFAATVQYHNYGHFDETSESGVVIGSFSGSEYSLALGWGRQLSPHWSIGAALKYAGLQLESYSAGALAVDVAGNYRADNGWIFSLTARNIGAQLFNNFDYRHCRLPLAIDFGASRHLDHLPVTVMLWYDDLQKWNKLFDDPLDLAGNYDPLTNEIVQESATLHFVKNLASHLVVGGELTLGKNIVLRAAYNYGQRHAMDVPQERTLVGFSAGLGVKIKMFEISYARSRSNILASPNYLTITMDLNKFK